MSNELSPKFKEDFPVQEHKSPEFDFDFRNERGSALLMANHNPRVGIAGRMTEDVDLGGAHISIFIDQLEKFNPEPHEKIELLPAQRSYDFPS